MLIGEAPGETEVMKRRPFVGKAGKNLDDFLRLAGLVREEIAYIGDDVNDIACMQYAGLSACPSDALDKVRSLADYVCSAPGGRGAVRELVDRITDDE